MNSDYLPENEVINYEDTLYVNPETSLQEQTTFIDNLRNVQNQNNAEIATDTANLGTAVPSALGGLGGGESYFTSRYQVPQGVALANNLRAVPQAQALNDAMNMNLEAWKKRLSDAQKAARKRAASYGGGGGGGTNTPDDLPITGGVEETDTTGTVVSVVPGVPGGYTVANIIPDWDNKTSEVTGYTYVPYGQDGKVNYVYGGGPSGNANAKNTTSENTLQPTNRLQPTNNLPNWGRL